MSASFSCRRADTRKRRLPSHAPLPPAGLVHTSVRFDKLDKPVRGKPAGVFLEAARDEWFIKGTEQSLFDTNLIADYSTNKRALASKVFKNMLDESGKSDDAPRITSPVTGTIIALDPDIPPDRQRLSFSAKGRGVRWLMDGKEFARGPEAQWFPWPGRHVVQLLGSDGKVADEIKLEVRGAGVREVSARLRSPATKPATTIR